MVKDKKLKLLFVCTVNRMRSATAHKIYEDDYRFDVKSAGTPLAQVCSQAKSQATCALYNYPNFYYFQLLIKNE
jgi:protein-tyrosine-phosphatase